MFFLEQAGHTNTIGKKKKAHVVVLWWKNMAHMVVQKRFLECWTAEVCLSFTTAHFTPPYGQMGVGTQQWELCTRHQQKPWVACLPCFTYYAACIENASTNAEENKYIAPPALVREGGWLELIQRDPAPLVQPAAPCRVRDSPAHCHRRDRSALGRINLGKMLRSY